METQKDIRTLVLKKRNALPETTRAAYSQEIIRLTAAHPFFLHAQEIFCYASYRDEVSTAGLMEAAWNMGKKLRFPG